MEQIRYASRYIREKTKDVPSEDIVMFVGDFNVNGHSENSVVADYRERLK